MTLTDTSWGTASNWLVSGSQITSNGTPNYVIADIDYISTNTWEITFTIKVANTGSFRGSFGITSEAVPDSTDDVVFGFNLRAGYGANSIRWLHNGNAGGIGTYALNDIFKIKCVAEIVTILKNDSVIYTYTPQFDYLDASYKFSACEGEDTIIVTSQNNFAAAPSDDVTFNPPPIAWVNV